MHRKPKAGRATSWRGKKRVVSPSELPGKRTMHQVERRGTYLGWAWCWYPGPRVDPALISTATEHWEDTDSQSLTLTRPSYEHYSKPSLRSNMRSLSLLCSLLWFPHLSIQSLQHPLVDQHWKATIFAFDCKTRMGKNKKMLQECQFL